MKLTIIYKNKMGKLISNNKIRDKENYHLDYFNKIKFNADNSVSSSWVLSYKVNSQH
jgi:hypothetical protein